MQNLNICSWWSPIFSQPHIIHYQQHPPLHSKVCHWASVCLNLLGDLGRQSDDPHICLLLGPRTCENSASHGQRDFADVIMLGF